MNFKTTFKLLLEKIDLLHTKSNEYDQKQLNKGTKVEGEHSDNKRVATKIAMQHFAEFPKKKDAKISSDYYKELDKMEGKLKKGVKQSFKDMVAEMDAKDLKENTMAGGAGSVFGPNVVTTATQFSGDNYATGDARIPKIIGMGTKGKGKKKKKEKIPIIRRTFVSEAHIPKTEYVIKKDGIMLRDGSSDRNYRGYVTSWGLSPAQAIVVYRKKLQAQGKPHFGNYDALELTRDVKDKIDARFARRANPAPNAGGPEPIIDGTPAGTGKQLTLGI